MMMIEYFQFPLWDTSFLINSNISNLLLSIPFMGYLSMGSTTITILLLSIPFMGYNIGLLMQKEKEKFFQFTLWDTTDTANANVDTYTLSIPFMGYKPKKYYIMLFLNISFNSLYGIHEYYAESIVRIS